MKLWDKGYTTDNLVEKFTVGKDRILDLKLAKYDIQGNVAHAKMLHKIKILSSDELIAILEGLAEIQETIDAGTFTIEDSFEDVHSKIEYELVQKIGDAGKKIHTARSRNDQVLVDLHLYTKAEINEMKELTKILFNTLMDLADKYKGILIPGYTHLQVAMPSSFGLWFSAYAESLIDDITILNAAYKVADQNPLGSAAGYGSSFPIDRTMTTELFGPVVTIYVYEDKDWSETLKLVDETSEYALTGSILSQDRYMIDFATKKLENAAGNFYINDKPTGAVVGQQPFGGARGSGTNDKAGSPLNLLRWVSPRTIKETFVTPTDYRYEWLG